MKFTMAAEQKIKLTYNSILVQSVRTSHIYIEFLNPFTRPDTLNKETKTKLLLKN